MAKIDKTEVTKYTLSLSEPEFKVLAKTVAGVDLSIDESRIHDDLMDAFNALRKSEEDY